MKSNSAGILQILQEASPRPDWSSATLDENLWETGLLDSFSIVNLIGLFEEKLGIVFDYTDLTRTNFDNVASIVGLLKTNYGIEIEN